MSKPEYLEVNEALSRASKKAYAHCCMNCEHLGQLKRKYHKKVGGRKKERFIYFCNKHPQVECGQQSAGCYAWEQRIRQRSDIPPVEDWGPF